MTIPYVKWDGIECYYSQTHSICVSWHERQNVRFGTDKCFSLVRCHYYYSWCDSSWTFLERFLNCLLKSSERVERRKTWVLFSEVEKKNQTINLEKKLFFLFSLPSKHNNSIKRRKVKLNMRSINLHAFTFFYSGDAGCVTNEVHQFLKFSFSPFESADFKVPSINFSRTNAWQDESTLKTNNSSRVCAQIYIILKS